MAPRLHSSPRGLLMMALVLHAEHVYVFCSKVDSIHIHAHDFLGRQAVNAANMISVLPLLCMHVTPSDCAPFYDSVPAVCFLTDFFHSVGCAAVVAENRNSGCDYTGVPHLPKVIQLCSEFCVVKVQVVNYRLHRSAANTQTS